MKSVLLEPHAFTIFKGWDTRIDTILGVWSLASYEASFKQTSSAFGTFGIFGLGLLF